MADDDGEVYLSVDPGDQQTVAARLLAAAEHLDLHARCVRAVSGGFAVPRGVFEAAGFTPAPDGEMEGGSDPVKRAPSTGNPPVKAALDRQPGADPEGLTSGSRDVQLWWLRTNVQEFVSRPGLA